MSRDGHYGEKRIIPAYAGSTCRSRAGGRSWRDHPRIRGEHVQMNRAIADGSGSSPHTRGAPQPRRRPPCRARIIPAYAGSTRCPCRARSGRGDHPRIRGEHPSHVSTEMSPKGSSPHTRGALRGHARGIRDARIIPAYAGSTSRWCARKPLAADHPRIRGEHCALVLPLSGVAGSSPHTRGAQPPGRRQTVHPGIIPAYAGSTSRPARGNHPRAGSSPHTRGAPT